jgi:hypothetical protein
MPENSDYITSAGYLILGILMLTLASFCLLPSSISVNTVQSFRIYGGATMFIIGILMFYLKKDDSTPALFMINGLLFLIAAGVTLTSNRDITLIVLAVGYLILATIMFLSNNRSLLVSLLLVFIAFNLISRFIFGTADDGTCIAGGIFCILSTILSLYIGFSFASERVKLPII